MPNCGTCRRATVRNLNGGKSIHREAMLALGFVGCSLDKSEATTRSTTLERDCAKWAQATAKQMEARK